MKLSVIDAKQKFLSLVLKLSTDLEMHAVKHYYFAAS